jgi:exosortase A-associated hydrolase 1
VSIPADHCEQVLTFECQGRHLLGIVSQPRACVGDLGVVIVVGGPQYRVGSHRQFVSLARHLAGAGIPVLRFDVRGMGDSEGDSRGFEAIAEDIGAAMSALMRSAPTARRIVLWGLCDGASAALMLDDRQPRAAALVLLNPWVRSPASLARTQVKHYYVRRLFQREFWGKLLRGGVGLRALRELVGNVAASVASTAPAAEAARDAIPFQDRMADGWRRFAGPILLVLSGDDYTAKEFIEYTTADERWRGLVEQPRVERMDFPDADHTFSNLQAARALEAATRRWILALRAT